MSLKDRRRVMLVSLPVAIGLLVGSWTGGGSVGRTLAHGAIASVVSFFAIVAILASFEFAFLARGARSPSFIRREARSPIPAVVAYRVPHLVWLTRNRESALVLTYLSDDVLFEPANVRSATVLSASIAMSLVDQVTAGGEPSVTLTRPILCELLVIAAAAASELHWSQAQIGRWCERVVKAIETRRGR